MEQHSSQQQAPPVHYPSQYYHGNHQSQAYWQLELRRALPASAWRWAEHIVPDYARGKTVTSDDLNGLIDC
jgi:hypothetical protein